jgi:hypothetical protein
MRTYVIELSECYQHSYFRFAFSRSSILFMFHLYGLFIIISYLELTYNITSCKFAFFTFLVQGLNHHYLKDLEPNTHKVKTNVLAVPPLENGNKFVELYDVILILDDREQFGRDNRGSVSSMKISILLS